MMPTELEALRAQLAAEREAHAAEVNWYRRALCEIEKQTVEGKDLAVVNLMVQHALAAPPTAAVEAVEGVRKALEPFKRFADRLDSPPNWVPDGCPINTDSGGISDFSVAQVRQARLALARWEEATNA